jgi:hypothetical protein
MRLPEDTAPPPRGGRATAVVVASVLALASSHCTSSQVSTGRTDNGVSASGAAADGATTPDGAPKADDSLDAGAPSSDASSSGDDGSSSHPASALGRGDAAPDAPAADGASAIMTTAWATWPMPNAPSSGLPHPQSYDTSVAGIAADLVTGLTWQRAFYEVAQQDADGGAVDAAQAYCQGLELGDQSDWRVPSRIELVSLLDFTAAPAENASVFPSTGDTFLSSSVHDATIGVGTVWQGTVPEGVLAGVVYLVPFMGAFDNGGPLAVRCVRGGQAPTGAHYTVADGTVHDNWTGLTWIQSPSSSAMLPSTVGSYCMSQTLAGGGWRAPSANELETLWGDFFAPDAVTPDTTTFADTSGALGSLDFCPNDEDAGAPHTWFYVGGEASTGVQEDVTATLPIVGVEPAMEYWVNAQCVR